MRTHAWVCCMLYQTHACFAPIVAARLASRVAPKQCSQRECTDVLKQIKCGSQHDSPVLNVNTPASTLTHTDQRNTNHRPVPQALVSESKTMKGSRPVPSNTCCITWAREKLTDMFIVYCECWRQCAVQVLVLATLRTRIPTPIHARMCNTPRARTRNP